MFKNYNKLENHFIDKKQLEKYNNKIACSESFSGELIIFSNKKNISELALNLDMFKNSTIIFSNSYFDTLSISESNCNNNKIIIINSKIKSCNIALSNTSDVDVSKCEIDTLYINNSHNINLIEINPMSMTSEMVLGTVHTNNILLKNINSNNLHTFDVSIRTKDVQVVDSIIDLEIEKSNNIKIINSYLKISKLNSDNNISIDSSGINKKLCNNQAYINSKLITMTNKNVINKCVLSAKDININKSSELYANESIFEIKEILNLENNALFNSQNTNINSEIISMDSNTKLNIDTFYLDNNTVECTYIEYNKLKNERMNLVKTLKKIQNKYNYKIKELKE